MTRIKKIAGFVGHHTPYDRLSHDLIDRAMVGHVADYEL